MGLRLAMQFCAFLRFLRVFSFFHFFDFCVFELLRLFLMSHCILVYLWHYIRIEVLLKQPLNCDLPSNRHKFQDFHRQVSPSV
jgi:hypothetical protein